MFYPNYNSEEALKKCAKFILGATIVLSCLLVIVALILIFVNTYLAVISFILLISAVVCSIPGIITAHLVWGLGEIVRNTRGIWLNANEIVRNTKEKGVAGRTAASMESINSPAKG